MVVDHWQNGELILGPRPEGVAYIPIDKRCMGCFWCGCFGDLSTHLFDKGAYVVMYFGPNYVHYTNFLTVVHNGCKREKG